MKLTWLILICSWLLAACTTSPATSQRSAQELIDRNPDRFVVVTLRNQPGPTVPRAGSTVGAYEAPSTYAVAPATQVSAKAIATAHGLREVTAWPIGLLGIHCIVFEVPEGADRTQILERLRRDRRVESAQPLQSFSTLSSASNDPYRGLQRNLDVMGVAGAHSWSLGEGVRVGLIDTGVDVTHPDLAGRIVKQENFVDGDARALNHDRHGTAVAGIIAAVENNNQGISGIAPAARLYALRACWPEPQDTARAVCSTLTLAKAIVASIERHMQIVNLSLSGPADPLLTRLVEVGINRGVVFVGAAPARSDQSSFPTSIVGVISVDASGGHGSADSVLFAPGHEVLTLVPDGRYDFLSGSSLAAASVTGGIALLLARDRTLRGPEAKEILARSSRSVSTAEGVQASINLCAALADLIRERPCE
jgi:hypothetical protein